MKILHICAGWQEWNGAANIARMLMDEQRREGHEVTFSTWASVRALRSADEVWIHCGWLPCLWWAALWGRNVHWMPEACYDPIRRAYHGWKKTLAGPIERFFLRRAKTLIATCEAEKGWIESYLGRRCPPIELTDIKRFFKLHGEVSTQRREDAEFSLGRCPRPPSAEGSPISLSAHSAPLRLCVKNNEQAEPLHLLYLGRRHPLKGVEYLETAVRQIEKNSAYSASSRLCVKHISNAFGDELEKVWDWCDTLILPTLSENFGLVIAEALERGKRVITTDGAPAWGDNLSRAPGSSWSSELELESGRVSRVEHVETCRGGEVLSGYNGRLIYLKGFRDGTDEKRVELLKLAIEMLGRKRNMV